jgi:alanine racemase
MADSSDKKCVDYTKAQSEKFFKVYDILKSKGIALKYVHHCNSAGLVSYDDERYTAYRAGIVLYGLLPDRNEKIDLAIKPLMEVKSYISMVKTVGGGECVSYGGDFKSDKETTLATIPMGYADGYIRDFSNRAEVLINGKRARVCGRVCMDQFVVDITGIDAKCGDEVVLMGKSGEDIISADELSEIASTINYETVCLIGKRVPRVYIKDNKTLAVMKDFCKVVY